MNKGRGIDHGLRDDTDRKKTGYKPSVQSCNPWSKPMKEQQERNSPVLFVTSFLCCSTSPFHPLGRLLPHRPIHVWCSAPAEEQSNNSHRIYFTSRLRVFARGPRNRVHAKPRRRE